MVADHYVKPISEANIARVASRCRQLATAALGYDFNVVNFIEGVLVKKFWKGSFEIVLLDKSDMRGYLAYVKYEPLRLYVDKRVWESARLNFPSARYIIAHEIGHLCLHDHSDFSYSVGKEYQVPFGEDIHSAEWQANIFAHHFLVPDYIAALASSAEELEALCAVEEQVAEKRYYDCVASKVRMPPPEGGRCKSCFRYAVFRVESGAKCFVCNAEAPLSANLKFKIEHPSNKHYHDAAQLNTDILISDALNASNGDPCPECGNFTLALDDVAAGCAFCNTGKR